MKCSFILTSFLVFSLNAQDPARFQGEVDEIKSRYDTLFDATRSTIVFTGSSSIRMWHDLPTRFPNHQVINSGFGGSQATDLLAYLDDLIFRFRPEKVFIYEGDNDIQFGKRPKTIAGTYVDIIDQIRRQEGDIPIVLISPKPSIARWKLRGKYKRLNRRLTKMAHSSPNLEFADVWHAMMPNGRLRKDVFIQDGLHMNAQGYDIWYDVLLPYVNR